MTTTRIFSALSLSLLLVVGLIVAAPVQAAEGKEISYEDAEPYLTAMEEAVEASESSSVNVMQHDDALEDFDPEELSSLMEYVKELAEEAEDSNGTTIVDRKFQMVGERLSVCLGTEHGQDSTVASTTFCQDLENNLLNRVILKDADGNVLGRYELN